MTISRIEMQGQITQTQDYGTLRHNEENQPLVHQNYLTKANEQSVELKLHQVNESEENGPSKEHKDAKEEGSNQYHGDGGQNRKKKELEGKVLGKGISQGFDMKI